jgi:hypothetical protein
VRPTRFRGSANSYEVRKVDDNDTANDDNVSKTATNEQNCIMQYINQFSSFGYSNIYREM